MKKVMDGNEACAHSAFMFTEVAGIYPITPASPMAEHIDKWSNDEKNIFGGNVKVVEMQSEGGAAGMLHGALQAGSLGTTFTASQGLLLMIPNMYKMSGEMLPGVMHVAARSIATHALSIFGDHSDIYSARGTGFAMLASSNVQQAMDMAAIAHLASIKSSIPFMHFFDGFRTSHELQKVEVLKETDVLELIDKDALLKFRKKALVTNKVTRGTAQNDDIYFQATEVRNKFYDETVDIVAEYMNLLGKKTSRNYKPFEYYGSEKATRIIVAMGSVCETIRETIDNMDGEVGLIEVHLYRPFSKKYFLDVMPKSIKKIAVLDRTKEPGSIGEPLFLDISSIFSVDEYKPIVVGGRYGLSSKDTTPGDIKAVYDFLDSENIFTGFTIGIDDDVTKKSLACDKEFKIKKENSIEFLIYGYGSDGMTSASKNMIKIIGENTDNYVQGYFQYDSKKSGSVTRAHIRIDDNIIRSTYYVTNPHLVVCTKDSYLNNYDLLKGIKEKGVFLLNTDKSLEELKLTDEFKKTIVDKNIRMVTIDASKIAREAGLGDRISTVIQSAIFYLTGIIPYDTSKNYMKEYASKRYSNKGKEIVEANFLAIDKASDGLREINVTFDGDVNISEKPDDIISKMTRLDGNTIPVSAFLESSDGTFEGGNTKYEKRGVSDLVSNYIPENCIQCGMCSMVCPHAVIRPFLLDEEEYNNAPEEVKKKCIDAIGPGMEKYKYIIGISKYDCTGCNLCVNICPGKGGVKALSMNAVQNASDNDYLFNKVTYKSVMNEFTIKGSQLRKPLFEFSGACSGCGETPYIKLLTQLFGERLVIANATGCSSIYGGSAPSTPYSVPWANSLFEDNAEYGFGLLTGFNTLRDIIKNTMIESMESVGETNKKLFNEWLENTNDYKITREVYKNLDYSSVPNEISNLKEYIPSKSVWTIGGDGWAYDIGYGGLDHVLASNENVNILVLDSQVYSNTGGQSSKASMMGSIAKFTSDGKKVNKKDLGRIAMCYPHVYVASISMGSNMVSAINAFKEAEEHAGPSIIIAYSPCIEHGIKGGMGNSTLREKEAVECGYVVTYRRSPKDGFKLYSTEPDFTKYEAFLEGERRYSMLKEVNPQNAKKLLDGQKQAAMERYKFYANEKPRSL